MESPHSSFTETNPLSGSPLSFVPPLVRATTRLYPRSPDHPLSRLGVCFHGGTSLSAADVTPTVDARETWFSRSPGFRFAQAHSRTGSFNFIYALLLFLGFCFSPFNVFFVAVSFTGSLVSWPHHGYWIHRHPRFHWNSLVRFNARHGYLMHRSPRVHRTPSRSTRTRSLEATHTLRKLGLMSGCSAHCCLWEKQLNSTRTIDRTQVR